MSMPDFTLVVGIDERHLRQLSWTWPTWKKHKPSLLSHDMLIFYDHEQVDEQAIRSIVDHPKLSLYPWPPLGVTYQGVSGNKWNDSQRYKMLSGFIHVPANAVNTKYLLKIDTDVVATGLDDWIDPDWFCNDPAIVSHPWTFTKPPDQMDKLDCWAESNRDMLPRFPAGPLELHPQPGASRLGHGRIISFIGFFDLEFTRLCAEASSLTCGRYQLPVPSQDGFTFYMSQRLDRLVVRTNMRKLGFSQWSADYNVQKHSEEAMTDGIENVTS